MKDFRNTFKTLARSKATTRAHHLQFALLKALTAKTNIDRNLIAGLIVQNHFTRITNEIKLMNGLPQWFGLRQAVTETWEDIHNIEAGRSVNSLISDLENAFEINAFKDLLTLIGSQVVEDELPEVKRYAYIFVRTDLTQEQQVVQSNHCALELGAELVLNEIDPYNLYFVVCSAKDEQELFEFQDFFEMYGVKTTSFMESDLNYSNTAFGTFPITERKKNKYFQNFQLLTYGEPATVASLNKTEE